MKFFTCLLYLLIPLLNIYPQSFEKTYGTIDDDEGNAVAVCQDGSYIITGSVQNLFTGDSDIYVARINVYGDTIWTKTIENPYHQDYGSDVVQCLDLGFAVTGGIYEDTCVCPFLVKFNENGQLEWFRTFQTEIPEGYAHTIEQSPDSTFVICGLLLDYSIPYPHNSFLLQTSRNGNVLWFKKYNGFAGLSRYIVNDMCMSSDGEFILGGRHQDLSVNPIYNSWLLRVHINPSYSWSNTYIKDEYTTSAVDVDLTADKGFIFVGSTFEGYVYMPGMDYDIFVVKTDSLGNEEWRTTIGYFEEEDHGNCIAQTDDGTYIIGGQREYGFGSNNNDDIWLIKIDEGGDTLWSRKFGGFYDDHISDIASIPDGGFILCGTTYSSGIGGSDIYLIRTDENGIVTGNIDFGIDKLEVNIYPNPFVDEVFIECPPDNYLCTIYDVSGKVLLAEKINGDSNKKLDVGNLKSGVYLLQIRSENYCNSYKILKQ